MDEFDQWAQLEPARKLAEAADRQTSKAIRRSIQAKLVKLKRVAEKRKQADLWHKARLREMGAQCPLTPDEFDKYARPQDL